MPTHQNVADLVARYDPFFGLGFRPIAGGFDHLPPLPTLQTLREHPEQIEYVRVSRRGHAYDLGRFAYFVNDPSRICGPITLSANGTVIDGHHRLGAAWLIGQDRVMTHTQISWPRKTGNLGTILS